MSQFFTSCGQSIGVSDSTSVLPMNIQDWFPLGWTGWISLQSNKEITLQFKKINVFKKEPSKIFSQIINQSSWHLLSVLSSNWSMMLLLYILGDLLWYDLFIDYFESLGRLHLCQHHMSLKIIALEYNLICRKFSLSSHITIFIFSKIFIPPFPIYSSRSTLYFKLVLCWIWDANKRLRVKIKTE